MAIRRQRRSRRGRHRRLIRPYAAAFNQGRIDGFQQGRTNGYAMGLSNAMESSAARNAAAAQPEQAPTDVLVIAAGHIPSLEIGVIQPLNALKERDKLRYEVKLEHEVSREMISRAKTIVFVRNVEPQAYTLLEMAKELGKRTVYVIDDNFLEIPPTTPVGVYYSDPQIQETFAKFLRNSQIVKVDAPDLGAYIEQKFNRKVVYFPASVDFDWLDAQPRGERESDQIVIGYEGGAKDEDFAPVIPALEQILAYYGGFVRMEFYGYVPASLADHPSVSYATENIPYREFIQKLNRCNWDIGLAPLAVNTFNNGKTNNKVREYGACRIPGVYSRSPVYTPWVTHGETGYLVPHTTEGWYEGIKAMIENPSMRILIKDNAEAEARERFSLNTCANNWKTAILDP